MKCPNCKHVFKPSRKAIAKELGKAGGSAPKTLTDTERERRRAAMKAIRKPWPKGRLRGPRAGGKETL